MTNSRETAKATARPWFECRNQETDKLSIVAGTKQIATIAFSQPSGEQVCNASLIVRAVNNHEALFEACQTMLSRLGAQGFKDNGMSIAELRNFINQASK
jgi:hypothetical protein